MQKSGDECFKSGISLLNSVKGGEPLADKLSELSRKSHSSLSVHSLIVSKGIDGCLFVYSLEDFEKRAEKIRSLPMAKARALQRSFMAWACEVEPDKQGRILVPQSLREVAGLEKEIVVAGVSDRCEIWDKKRWDDFNSSIDDNELMEALEGLDF